MYTIDAEDRESLAFSTPVTTVEAHLLSEIKMEMTKFLKWKQSGNVEIVQENGVETEKYILKAQRSSCFLST